MKMKGLLKGSLPLMNANLFTLVEINQNVTTSFPITCDFKSFVTKFQSIYNYKIKFQLFWSFIQL